VIKSRQDNDPVVIALDSLIARARHPGAIPHHPEVDAKIEVALEAWTAGRHDLATSLILDAVILLYDAGSPLAFSYKAPVPHSGR
jgi:hypothetical protein